MPTDQSLPSENPIATTTPRAEESEAGVKEDEQGKKDFTTWPRHGAIKNALNARVPACAGHRGYKARYPENTMVAFTQVLATGTNAIEFDLHVSRDGVVVVTHDPTLKRCFGVKKKKVLDCDWEYLSKLRTVGDQHPSGTMPRFVDVLDLLDGEGLEDVWGLVDIKVCLFGRGGYTGAKSPVMSVLTCIFNYSWITIRIE